MEIFRGRLTTWIILIVIAVFYVLSCMLLPVWSEPFIGITSVLIFLTTEFLVFLLHLDLVQEQPSDDTADYTAMIANIEDVGKKLADLGLFLRRERERVEASEATMKKLRSEHTQLEPVVTAERERVDAILAVYVKATASKAWKQWLIAFITGVITSLIASVIIAIVSGQAVR
jgi:hypothetical protein